MIKYENLSKAKSAEALGYHPNHFYVLKTTSREKYDYLMNICSYNLYVAQNTYIEEMKIVKEKMVSFFYDLESHSKIHTFGVFMKEKGLYKNDNCFSTSVGLVLFNSRDGFATFMVYQKYKKMLKYRKQFSEKYNLWHKE